MRPTANRPGRRRVFLGDLSVEYRAISSLEPHARNPRIHSPKQVRQIADSIRAFGFVNPILIDAASRVIAGHGRVAAAKLLGIKRVPTIRLDHMSETQKRAYAIADNRLAELAGWDRDLLRIELAYVAELGIDFDLTLTGFETAEIDLLITPVDLEGASDDFDACPPVDISRPAVSQVGDLWALDRHRLLCGDTTRPETFDQLMGGKQAQMVFTDPPYNLPIDGHVCGRGLIKHREFAMAAGEMSGRMVPRRTSTMSNSVASGAIAPMSGTIRASTLGALGVKTSLRYTRQ